MTDGKREYKLNKCDRGWFTLKKIEGETEVRYCDTCDKTIHWCNTEEQVKEAVVNKWCIATENKLLFKDLPPKSSEEISKGGWLGEAEINTYLIDLESRDPSLSKLDWSDFEDKSE